MKLRTIAIFFGTIIGAFFISALITILFSNIFVSESNGDISTSVTSSIKQKSCIVSGCSNQLCIEEGSSGVSTCEYNESYLCYRTAKCERQQDGKCGWTQDENLKSCIDSYKLKQQ